ncbi:hypothetical protein BDZ91DRAFT_721349 [Kalaharituber pfeilii]|nr:hypothetical protein BDZ91DRAFT_721349 [Kalaharituber pfeilii]
MSIYLSLPDTSTSPIAAVAVAVACCRLLLLAVAVDCRRRRRRLTTSAHHLRHTQLPAAPPTGPRVDPSNSPRYSLVSRLHAISYFPFFYLSQMPYFTVLSPRSCIPLPASALNKPPCRTLTLDSSPGPVYNSRSSLEI